MKVFVSSTMLDLGAYHEAAVQALLGANGHPISMRNFGAVAKGATAASLEKVRTADLYIGIFANRYGHIEPGYDRSITELEFDCAGECGLDRLCFVLDPKVALASEPDPHRTHLARFRRKVNRLVVDTFRSVDDFRVKLISALFKRSVRHAAAGLNALIDLMDAPAVRVAVWQIRNELRSTSRQLQDLNDHKLVHEALHDLQFQCYELVIAARRRNPQELHDPDLERYEEAFLSILEKLRRLPNVANNGDTIWISRLQRAQQLFSTGLNSGDVRLCDESILQLKAILEIFPSIVNDRIARVTRSLSLAEFATVLATILARMERFDPDERRMREFHNSVSQLASLSHKVKATVEVHDRWQQLDTLLRIVNSTIQSGTADLEAVWHLITASVDALLRNPTERIALLANSHRQLAGDLQEKDMPRVLQHFDTFRWRAGQLFHTADQELKQLCDDLREIGNTVQRILDMVDTSFQEGA